MSGIKNEAGGGERVPRSSDVSLCDRPSIVWSWPWRWSFRTRRSASHGGPGAWSHLAPRPPGEPRWWCSLAQVYPHLSSVSWQDRAQVGISRVSLEAKGPQREKRKKSKMRSHWPYIDALLKSKSWWQNLGKGKIIATFTGALLLSLARWWARPHWGPSMSQHPRTRTLLSIAERFFRGVVSESRKPASLLDWCYRCSRRRWRLAFSLLFRSGPLPGGQSDEGEKAGGLCAISSKFLQLVFKNES